MQLGEEHRGIAMALLHRRRLQESEHLAHGRDALVGGGVGRERVWAHFVAAVEAHLLGLGLGLVLELGLLTHHARHAAAGTYY